MSVAPVAAEILLLSVLLAWAVGVGLTRPVRDLDARTKEFGKDPEAGGLPMAPTDDEIGALASSFAEMQDEVRAVQARLRESERRAATAELLAGVAQRCAIRFSGSHPPSRRWPRISLPSPGWGPISP